MDPGSPSPPLSPPPPLHAGPSHATKANSETSDEVEQPSTVKNGESAEEVDVEKSQKQAAEAKKRHQADLALHAYEPPRVDRPQDDWQVAYVWAFIVKFNMKDRIKRLECLEDFERALVEPVANRPDDILEGILVRFLGNLKPGLRNLDCTNIQHHLLNYISEQLLLPNEFTVWDRPWAPNEEARGSCCNSARDRTELGKLRYNGEPMSERVEKNPLRQVEKRGGGLFELDWRERARMLRQLVDWQLNHSDHIRAIINKENHAPLPRGATVSESQGKVNIEPLGMDRNKQRIWMLDNSGRIYKSGNPFKRPCPIYAISSNKAEMQEQIDKWAEHGNSSKPVLKGKADLAAKKAIKGIEDEKKLAEAVGGLMEAVEREDGRIARARKRIADNAKIFEQAEFRSTRTRRTTKKVDYAYDGEADDLDEYEDQPRRPRRGDDASTSSRPVIPGERKSARLTRKDVDETVSYSDSDGGDNGFDSRGASPEGDGTLAKKHKVEEDSEVEWVENGKGSDVNGTIVE